MYAQTSSSFAQAIRSVFLFLLLHIIARVGVIAISRSSDPRISLRNAHRRAWQRAEDVAIREIGVGNGIACFAQELRNIAFGAVVADLGIGDVSDEQACFAV